MLLSVSPDLSKELCMDVSIARVTPNAGLAASAQRDCELLHNGWKNIAFDAALARRTTPGALIPFAPRPRFGQCLKRLGIEHDDNAVLEANPFAGRPGPQLLIDALPGPADHLAYFLLGDRDRAAPGREFVFLGQANERAGEPARQILKNNLLDLVAG